ncbi:hypothetical protein K443DRAFT_125866 [Laccaria amethystina LaAM-08-1]|jgi:hypothetical protein|uniref:Uncharacterized protein n=1 Tax=Laccaria amethystina LaAM-08-1 TaxID=1095629 RepID=A0A0C9X8H2_9AGAR|nr:hypothetical protein K443DRAFT_125866 [Laccaria amethystina LaAM-08-1]
MPFFLIPLAIAAKAVVVKLGAVAAHHAAGAALHHAAVATAAHAGSHAVLHGGAHFARLTVHAALAAGSIVAAVSILSSAALGAIVFYGQVEKYRELNHLDENGKRKTEFHQIDKCNSCSCSDFTLGSKESDTAYCVCGHAWEGHSYSKVDDMKEEFRRYAKNVGIDTAKSTFGDVMKHMK